MKHQQVYISIMIDPADRPVGAVVKDVAVGAGGLGFNSLAGQIEHCRRYPTMFCFSVAQALNRRNGPCHSLHAAA